MEVTSASAICSYCEKHLVPGAKCDCHEFDENGYVISLGDLSIYQDRFGEDENGVPYEEAIHEAKTSWRKSLKLRICTSDVIVTAQLLINQKKQHWGLSVWAILFQYSGNTNTREITLNEPALLQPHLLSGMGVNKKRHKCRQISLLLWNVLAQVGDQRHREECMLPSVPFHWYDQGNQVSSGRMLTLLLRGVQPVHPATPPWRSQVSAQPVRARMPPLPKRMHESTHG